MSETNPHFAKHLFFACMDDRLVESHLKFIIQLGGAFYPAIAGGGMAFLDDTEQATALAQVAAAYRINHISDIYLESHTDCGAYSLSGAVFTSADEELERLYSDLDLATDLARQAVIGAGAQPDEVKIHVSVVDPAGRVLPRPQLASA